MSNQVAIIGPYQMVLPLKESGIAIFSCDNGRQAEQILDKIHLSKKFDVIFITEVLASDTQEKIAELENSLNIVLIPDHKGSIGLFKERLNGLIKHALGGSLNK
ncbi:hypothetical protein A2526_03345 [candidate division WOR-1 bacterium RIFOXYD2_FULL_36_8]|uniref:V-type ATP synthase subunit F n=1 Tax=candidate division WOR-1 bacterium RIFOXYB2_FULL_36_35 TaxID=1802578 RepID=A0A1F4S1Z5_UNCSA|nr:MAG: hypothetical protein A2230_00220 [candidate division WOR-1 bacterium RIFOXYA2_FULL_36_21]OGC13743.1 MAG: hypothetical protein A2290_07710 [candidate division WOR-1 bacterium RIFOXYB2_FULL_36_35]OGC14466.1 MAG: hypothetical protein A2282_08710 [candidate division WOR-1 bacterium RIFOXYA12_FULL_36_13]OGC41786.1 MAG: hypothetical protein A2526_03345 [candidate division WOR-1 bacterium RIFOXYD2_FULL_36_8]